MPLVEAWIDLETVVQNEVSQKEKNKHHVMLLIYETQKNDTDELICKAEIETQMQKTNVWIPREEEEWDGLGDRDLHVYSAMYKTDNQ